MRTTNPEHCEPAASVIARMGGVTAVAAITGRSAIQVRRWRLRHAPGTAGIIPDADKAKLILAAKERGIALDWADFKPPVLADTG